MYGNSAFAQLCFYPLVYPLFILQWFLCLRMLISSFIFFTMPSKINYQYSLLSHHEHFSGINFIEIWHLLYSFLKPLMAFLSASPYETLPEKLKLVVLSA